MIDNVCDLAKECYCSPNTPYKPMIPRRSLLFERVCRGIIIFMSNKWTPDLIENYKNASEYTSFHRKLSVLAEPYLDEKWSLADIGCGPALIDYWLAPMVASIDLIDNDPEVISYLSDYLDDVFMKNRATADKIKPILADFHELEDERWDVVMMSFFGVTEEGLQKAMSCANHRVLIFMHSRPDTAGPFAALDDGNKLSASAMEAYLTENNYAYKKNVIEMQFGQPFKSIEQIHDFLSSYGEGDDFDKRMTDIEERIINTNRFDYPYYLPKSISVALFIIST